jgi:integrase
MASIVKQSTANGTRYFIQLSDGEDVRRPKIHLGAVTRKQAESALTHIETLLKDRKTGAVMPTATQEWLGGIPDGLRERFEKLSILSATTKSRWTVSVWVADYIAKRPDVKEGTRRKWRDVEGKLAVFFKNDILDDVTVQHGKAFRIYLKTTVGLSENTIRRHIGICRQFFNAAINAEIITKNPFRGQSVSVQANESRFFYVTSEMAQKVLDACPDASWRLIFGLARFGGLRCPSEVVRLKWVDVDFEKQRFTVFASKTEHHADGGIRVVPMFPELRPLFQDAFDHAPDGAVYCIDRYKGQWSNVGVHMARIIKRAGLDVWPKLFQNLRSTRETELFKITGGNVKAVCNWIGNTPAVAMTHYAQVTEADIQEAAKMSLLSDAEKEVQNPVQIGAESSRTESHDTQEEPTVSPCLCESKREFATPCEVVQKDTKWAVQDLNL